MGKILIKYLYLLNLLLIVGVSGLYADSVNDLSFGEAYHAENSHDVKHPCFHTNHHGSSHGIDLTFTEVEDTENEESSTKNKVFIDRLAPARYNAALFSNLSFQLQKDLRRHDIYYGKSATKLHVRIQVFRI
ncbi:hypothetical protein [Tamlana crocina]|uniref:Uncharacterized protein n=1 Tax=Tamlana crocina TaxID=393006 RepID=A0ABX1DA73_9FLAO|nr:hypothetical protein [Tamlana crocina]NJX13923.1 hypothetical protein [Tamlana crocina]